MKSATHISLNVSDLERSVSFYTRFLGEPKKRKPGYAKFVSWEPEIHLALEAALEGSTAKGGALSHLGIRVGSTEEVLRWKSALTERGLPSRDEMGTSCCYARQDKIWVEDPDGTRWEIYTVLEDLNEEKPEDRPACCASSCCT